MTVRFVVEQLFDLASRGGVILSGHLDGGDVAVGTVLRAAASGKEVRVIGIEFHTKPGKYAIIVDRGGFVPSNVGEVLIGPSRLAGQPRRIGACRRLIGNGITGPWVAPT